MKRSLSFAAALALAFCVPCIAVAQDRALDFNRALLFADAPAAESGADSALRARFSEAAASALVRAFASRGVALEPAATAAADPSAVSAASREAGARWAVSLLVALEGRRVLWRMSAYDAADGSLRAADSFVAFAGLTALPMLDSSADAVAAAWERANDLPPVRLPLTFSLRFRSGDSGALLRFSSASVPEREAGSVPPDGEFEAAYAPFVPGERVSATLSRDGYWPRTVSFPPRADKAVRLPALQIRADEAFGFNLGFGRLLGAAASYRSYIHPDSLYWRAENAAWATTSFQPGSRPVFHDELRLGLGAYPYPKPDGRLRLSVGAGASFALTWVSGATLDSVPIGADLCLEPFWFALEYHLPRWAFVVEQRFPYSLGLGSGYLERGWLSMGDNGGPPLLSFGAMRKW